MNQTKERNSLSPILKLLMILAMTSMLVVPPAPVRADTVESVFKGSLWGGALGTLAGAAIWGMQGDPENSELLGYLMRGASIGVLCGMAYGVYDASTHASLNQPPVQGLVHLDSRTGQTQVSLAQGLPVLNPTPHGLTVQSRLLTVEF